MKKIYFLGTMLISALTFAQQALPFADSFSYPVGNLHETSPWSVLGTAHATDHILLDGTQVTFAGIGTDAQVTIAPQTSGTLFYKLNLNISTMAGVTDPNGGYLSGFTANSTTFGGTLWTKRGADDSTFNLGIETRTANGVNTTFTSGTYATGTDYTIVVGYTFNTGTTNDDVVKLWINPTAGDEASPLLTDAHTGTDLTSIVSFFLRQDSATETPSIVVDNLKVSTTFADVLARNSFDLISGLKVYPNPVVNGNLFITSDSNEAKSVAIFDVLGKQVIKTTITNQAVNVASLNTGIYIVKITEDGKTATRKLVIK